jgi:predicted CopG family antitoxin
MSTIRVSDEVKERLRDLKRDDETFNDLLDRLSRSEKDVEAIERLAGGPPVDDRPRQGHSREAPQLR